MLQGRILRNIDEWRGFKLNRLKNKRFVVVVFFLCVCFFFQIVYTVWANRKNVYEGPRISEKKTQSVNMRPNDKCPMNKYCL